MLDVLKCKLWALPPKVDVFRCINNEVILSALTKNATEAKIHVLPMNHLRFDVSAVLFCIFVLVNDIFFQMCCLKRL